MSKIHTPTSCVLARRGLVSLVLVTMLVSANAPAIAASSGTPNGQERTADMREAQDLVVRSRMALNDFLTNAQMGDPVRTLLRRAQAVAIFPQVLEGAFVFGAAGGTGIVLARRGANTWSDPAFYTMGEMSFGLQAGGEASEVLLVALTDRGRAALQSTSAKLGADAGVALGPMGLGAAAATENLSADIVSYVMSKGLYAGVSVSGSVVAVRTALNQAYYGRPVTPTDILVAQTVTNRQAGPLVGEIRRIAS